jgi:hypothetical protein
LLVLVRFDYEHDYEREHEFPFGCGPRAALRQCPG